MSTLHLQLLGNFSLSWGTKQITAVRSGRLQSLLAFLVLHRDAPQPRQHLAFLFWPDATQAQAHNNFRQLLFELRRTVPHSDRFLSSRGLTLQWCATAPFTLDVDDLQVALERAACAAGRHDRAEQKAALERVSSLYRGDLLPTCYDDWIAPERERLRERYDAALEQMIQLSEDERDYAAAIAYSQQLLRHDAVREGTYRRLMRLCALTGDRAGVARAYSTCVRVLNDELGVEPSAETRAEYERDLAQTVSSHEPAPSVLASRHNLPTQLTRFIGREEEKRSIKRLVAAHRLVTLTGAGGVGKTRLALEIAGELVDTFSDGAWWVDLTRVNDRKLLAQEIASALRMGESRALSALHTCIGHMRDKELVLVLDNCEHMVEEAGQIAESLLSTCPNLHILVTSREVLQIAGEITWRVASLSFPAEDQLGQGNRTKDESALNTMLQFESVQVFVDRAMAALPTFAASDQNIRAIGQICRRLDGIPLALELAAGRIHAFSPQQIAARLDDRFNLLTSGNRATLPRHQTLRALIGWSYDLLSESERLLLQRLSVFAGGFTLEAAESVCADDDATASRDTIRGIEILDGLSQLIVKSMVIVERTEAAVRYDLLETIRQYAHEKLLEGHRTEQWRDRHLAFFLRLAEEISPKLTGTEEGSWLDVLERDHGNFRAAFDWARETGNCETALRLGCALDRFWFVHGHFTEAREHYTAALAMPGADELQLTHLRAEALYHLSSMVHYQTDLQLANRLMHASLEIFRRLGDKKRMADALAGVGLVAWERGEYALACSAESEHLAIQQELGDKPAIAHGLMLLGMAVRESGNYAEGRQLLEQALKIDRELGLKQHTARTLMHLGSTVLAQGGPEASSILLESLALFHELGDKWGAARVELDLGRLAACEGDLESARTRFRQALLSLLELNDRRNLIKCLEGLAEALMGNGKPDEAARLLGASESLRQALGTPLPTTYRAHYDGVLSLLRSSMDIPALAARWEEGRAMTLEQAVECALAA